MKSNDYSLHVFIGGVLIAIASLIVYFWPAGQMVMTVRSMEWQYIIRDVEIYTMVICTNQKIGKVTTLNCTPRTNTRIIGEWKTEGYYPQPPVWPTGYHITHKEQRYERYWVNFSDDKDIYPYRTGSLSDYQRFKPRQKATVTLNIFRMVIAVQ